MSHEKLAEAIRLMGACTFHTRVRLAIEERSGGEHPLAEAHAKIARDARFRAYQLFADAFLDGDEVPNAVYRTDDGRTPEQWRREAERAARCLEIGSAFAESLEERAQARRRTDDARREELSARMQIKVVAPIESPAPIVSDVGRESVEGGLCRPLSTKTPGPGRGRP